MTRRQARENAFMALFSTSFGNSVEDSVQLSRDVEDYPVDAFGEDLLRLYAANGLAVDGAIEKYLKGWRVERLPRVSLSILRLSVTEMCYGSPDMDSVVINEAVEMAKKYGDEQDYQFINGVLGSISREKSGTASAEPAGSV